LWAAFPRDSALAELLRWMAGSGAEEILVGGLSPGALALCLARFCLTHGRPTLVVTGSAREAERFARATGSFAGLFAEAAGGALRVHHLPPPCYWPYQFAKLPEEDRLQRIRALTALADDLRAGRPHLAVTSPEGVLSLLPRPESLLSRCFSVAMDDRFRRDELAERLLELGYSRVDRVQQPGDFAMRGGIIDLLGPMEVGGLRIELLGDRVLSLRRLDVGTQKSTGRLKSCRILPLREVDQGPEALERVLAGVEADPAFRRLPAMRRRIVLEELSLGLERERHEAAIRAHAEPLVPLLDWFPEELLLVISEPADVDSLMVRFGEQAVKMVAENPTELLPAADRLFLDRESWRGEAAAYRRVLQQQVCTRGAGLQIACRSVEWCEGCTGELAEKLSRWVAEGSSVIAMFNTAGALEKARQSLADHELQEGAAGGPDPGALLRRPEVEPGELRFLVGGLDEGFYLPGERLIVLSELEMFGRALIRRESRRWRERDFGLTFEDLEVGDYVVHVDHGIGRYAGIKRIREDGVERDLLVLEYAEGSKLMVPVDRLGRIQRYVALGDHEPPLDRLGGTRWVRLRKRVKREVLRIAAELIKLYARRQVVEGFAFSPDGPWHREFALGFPYEETPDQLRAMADVARDMEQPRPMDRLICGDVGYGKTEIAMRAAFKAAFDGKQVAVLTPTTVLAQQHYETFSRRFARFPMEVMLLSRLVGRGRQQEVLAALEKGVCDIVIGTHRLLSADLKFKDLGLLIIDEEHRFGVKAKERLKALRTQIDVLSMTATPIPRTLNLGLSGIRDMSLIATPPEDRLPIETRLARFDPELIRATIIRELERGGQVFFVHNRVQSIASVARFLRRLVPEAHILIGHGQMTSGELRRVMSDFARRRADILVCTAIIESGLDIPSANTIIINRADTFGMAQLYQLRGRVGRDRYQAYALLLVPGDRGITPEARRRLQAIAQATELGAGFRVASADLEIRGTGEILGARQHGHIAAIGFEMYTQLLREAVRELRGQAATRLEEPELQLPFSATIPEDYVAGEGERLGLYRRFAACGSAEELAELLGELSDRFGAPPVEVENLVRRVRLRLEAVRLHLERIVVRGVEAVLTFHHLPGASPEEIIDWVSAHPGVLRFGGDRAVVYHDERLLHPEGIERLCAILGRLGE
jgi:transcription-repair coupling factor (superfamily II helicase)